jgi:hypothetical protein
VLRTLRSCPGNEAIAKELAEILRWTISKVRCWLGPLRAAGLVEQNAILGKVKESVVQAHSAADDGGEEPMQDMTARAGSPS